jgi:hypothetical protein
LYDQTPTNDIPYNVRSTAISNFQIGNFCVTSRFNIQSVLSLWWLIWYCVRCVVDSDNVTYIVIAFFVLPLETTRESANGALSRCILLVLSLARQTARCLAALCRHVALSLGL